MINNLNLLPLSSTSSIRYEKKENFFLLKIIAINLVSSHLDLEKNKNIEGMKSFTDCQHLRIMAEEKVFSVH